MKYLKITWVEFQEMLDKLLNIIKKDNIQYDGIYGVPRGGYVLAICLSHQLNIPMLAYPTEKSLVVDDISDTGKTLFYMKRKKIVCLFSTDWTITVPDYFIDKKLNKEEWIVYPWETSMEERQTTLDEFIKK